MGRYYVQQELATWGTRPAGDPTRFVTREGEPTEGTYSIFTGFDGWWGGDIDHETIEDRFGPFPASPRWSGGADLRTMAVFPTSQRGDREIAAFPMEVQGYVAAHPTENLTAYLDLGLQGSQNRYENGFDAQDRIWLRELFLMAHGFRGNTYVRAGRFAPPFGWRVPDHTAFTRAYTGFDQFRQGYGAEVGFAPNEFWGNLAVYRQGVEAWPGDNGIQEGYAVTAQGGFKGLGYQLGGTAHAMGGPDGYQEYAGGAMWSLNLDPVIYLGETDWARTRESSDHDATDALIAYHEVQVRNPLRGVTPRVRYEWVDPNILIRDDHLHRVLFGAEWFPVSYLSVDLAYRATLPNDGSDGVSEVLLQLHTFY